MAEKKRKNSRRKGQTAERKLVKLFEKWWGSPFFRTPGSGAFATRGFMNMDLQNMAGDIVTTDPQFPFCVESKKVEGWTLEQMLTSDKTLMHEWWAQTVAETPKGKIPLLVFTKNHAATFVMMHMYHPSLLPPGIRCFYVNTEVIFCLDDLFKTQKSDWIGVNV